MKPLALCNISYLLSVTVIVAACLLMSGVYCLFNNGYRESLEPNRYAAASGNRKRLLLARAFQISRLTSPLQPCASKLRSIKRALLRRSIKRLLARVP